MPNAPLTTVSPELDARLRSRGHNPLKDEMENLHGSMLDSLHSLLNEHFECDVTAGHSAVEVDGGEDDGDSEAEPYEGPTWEGVLGTKYRMATDDEAATCELELYGIKAGFDLREPHAPLLAADALQAVAEQIMDAANAVRQAYYCDQL